MLEECCLRPCHCGVNRLAGESGKCHITTRVMISSYGHHFGEEAPLVGRHGSGTIFFTYCNLRCVFCQNYTISQLGEGDVIDREELSKIMLSLQTIGCHNINLVSPTHVVTYILDALELAVSMGLYLPLVYNSGGYDSILNIMSQYYPAYKAFDIPLLSRQVNRQEFNEAIDLAHQQGMDRLDRYSSIPLRFAPKMR